MPKQWRATAEQQGPTQQTRPQGLSGCSKSWPGTAWGQEKIRGELVELQAQLEELQSDFDVTVRMVDPAIYLQGKEALAKAKQALEGVLLNYGDDGLTMDVDTLGEDLDIIHNHLTTVQQSHHTLLRDVNGELPTQHQASMARDIAAGYGHEMGLLQAIHRWKAGEHERGQTSPPPPMHSWPLWWQGLWMKQASNPHLGNYWNFGTGPSRNGNAAGGKRSHNWQINHWLKTQQRRPKRSSTHSSRLRRGRPSRGGSPISVTYLKKQGWEALAPTTHPADVLGLQKGAREAQTRGGSRQIPDTSTRPKLD